MTPAAFIAQLGPPARASMRSTGIPASFVVAEGALESGWGDSTLARQALNLFGVKADTSWSGPTYAIQTREYLDGAWCVVPALWRQYSDWGGCITDHAQFFLTNPRYRSALLCKSGEMFAQAVAAAGYATDPAYAQKLIALIRQFNLAPLDAPLPPATPT